MKPEFTMSELAKELTLEVTITGGRVFGFRIWLGSKIIKLAALVMGCGIEITGPK
jgi:hypothetical protein